MSDTTKVDLHQYEINARALVAGTTAGDAKAQLLTDESHRSVEVEAGIADALATGTPDEVIGLVQRIRNAEQLPGASR